MNKNEVVEIDLWKLLLACLKKWWLIFIAVVLFGTGTYVGSKLTIEPTYSSTLKLYINNNLNIGNISISAADLSASIKLVDVYDVILRTKDTLDEISQKSGLSNGERPKYTAGQIRSMLSTTSVNDTQVIQITVTNTSPEDAYRIAATLASELPDIFTGIIEGSVAKVVENPVIPTSASGPSYSKNAIIGALLGAILAVAIIVILELFDTTIKSEEDLLDIIDVPILTYIPDFENSQGKKDAKNQRYYYHRPYSKEAK